MPNNIQTPYASAIPFFSGSYTSWADVYDQQRLASYDLYDDLYHSAPDAVQMLLRGSDSKPIYIPTAKRLVNTIARYVGRGWGVVVDPKAGTAEQRTELLEAFTQLFRRERILSQFAMGKKEFIRRGDWVWLLIADPDKPEGKRISVKTVDPRTFFPIPAAPGAVDPDGVSGYMLVEETVLADGMTYAIKRQRWLKPDNPDYPNEDGDDIAYDEVLLAIADWDNPNKQKVLQTITALDTIPGIKTLPLYHIKNNEESQNPFGLSDLAGLESIVAGINQSASDEDLSLSMSGLGQYVTDSGAPFDEETKTTVPWILGPKRVIEVALGRKFERINGITTITPFQDHIHYLEDNIFGVFGINDIALGKTSTTTPPSGISLAIEMQPLFDMAADKNLSIDDLMNQMLYDLATYWFPTYEGLDFGEATITSATSEGDLLPFDRASRFTELQTLWTDGAITLDYFLGELTKDFGYVFPANMAEDAKQEAADKAAAADPFGQVVAQTAEDATDPTKPADDNANAAAK